MLIHTAIRRQLPCAGSEAPALGYRGRPAGKWCSVVTQTWTSKWRTRFGGLGTRSAMPRTGCCKTLSPAHRSDTPVPPPPARCVLRSSHISLRAGVRYRLARTRPSIPFTMQVQASKNSLAFRRPVVQRIREIRRSLVSTSIALSAHRQPVTRTTAWRSNEADPPTLGHRSASYPIPQVTVRCPWFVDAVVVS